MTRAAWLDVARRAKTQAIEVEVQCSDRVEHRQRIEARGREGNGPTWQQVVDRDYRPWQGAAHTFDTARMTVDEVVAHLRASLGL